MFYLDGGYYIVILITFIISLVAQINVQSTFSRYSNIRVSNGITGVQTAARVLSSKNISNVSIVSIEGSLTDHYDPSKNTVALSQPVYNVSSVSAVSVAAHECGHAMQHAFGYFPLTLRTSIVPLVNFSSKISWIFIIIGLFFNTSSGSTFLKIGIILFSVAVAFQLVTLPVEFNASSRALKTLQQENMLTDDELRGARKVLRAAALTYVAAACVALLQLLRLIAISRDRD